MVVPAEDFNYAALAAATASSDSAPSSPKSLVDDVTFDLFFHCTSEPTSPARAAAIYEHFCTYDGCDLPPPPATSGVPFNWEEKPGTPKSHLVEGDGGDKLRFAFGRCEEVEFASEDNVAVVVGEARRIIPPLKPPPRLQYAASMDDAGSAASSQRSPRPRGMWSSGHLRRGGGGGREGDGELDPFTIAMMKATRGKLSTSSSFDDSAERCRGVDSDPSGKRRLRELLLFKSATSRDSLGKYAVLPSSRSPSSNTKVDAFGAEETMKKKSALLLRRQGLLSCIRFGSSGHGKVVCSSGRAGFIIDGIN